MQQLGVQEAPFHSGIALETQRLPPHHGDPMDRMIAATAITLGLTLVASDRCLQTLPALSIPEN
jgi:PIN domain nuclease of toxin-antitoxin system